MKKWIVYSCCLSMLSYPAFAQDEMEGVEELEEFVAEETTEDSFGIISSNVSAESVFGLDMTLLEVPRNVTQLSGELLDKFGIDSVYDLSKVSAGTFSNSFFGIDGQPTIRGTFSEVYFRGMKRIENPGSYPVPLRTAYNLDVVRGPASPIYGPSKLGGYINVTPKSARSTAGKYGDGIFGSISATYGSYDKKIGEFEFGTPFKVGEKAGGFYSYFMVEDSDSFWNNVTTEQQLGLIGVDLDLTDKVTIEAGVQFHFWKGVEVGGWNRVTQDLIDNGNYIRGVTVSPDDIANGGNGNGFVDGAERNDFFNFRGFGAFAGPTPPLQDTPDGAVAGSTSQLDPQNVLVDPLDSGFSDNILFYLDVASQTSDTSRLVNKNFFEHNSRGKDTTYAYNQASRITSYENKTTFDFKFEPTEYLFVDSTIAGSIKSYNASFEDDFNREYFDRRDLITGPTSGDRFQNGFLTKTNDTETEYIDYGIGALSNITVKERLKLLLGGRFDYIDLETTTNIVADPFGTPIPAGTTLDRTDSFWSYNASLSYDLPVENIQKGMKATTYITSSRQEVLNTGQAGEVTPALVRDDLILNGSELLEAGLKVEAFEGRFFASFAVYTQETSSFSSQSSQNRAVIAEGYEIEMRAHPTDNLTILASATFQKTEFNPNTAANATSIFANSDQAAEILGLTPEQILPETLFLTSDDFDFANFSEVAGLPDKTFTFASIYEFDNGFSVNGALTYYAEHSADRFKSIQLPDALLVDLGVGWKNEDWDVSLLVKNVTGEEWFRANSFTLFSSVLVTPQPDTTFEIKVTRFF